MAIIYYPATRVEKDSNYVNDGGTTYPQEYALDVDANTTWKILVQDPNIVSPAGSRMTFYWDTPIHTFLSQPTKGFAASATLHFVVDCEAFPPGMHPSAFGFYPDQVNSPGCELSLIWEVDAAHQYDSGSYPLGLMSAKQMFYSNPPSSDMLDVYSCVPYVPASQGAYDWDIYCPVDLAYDTVMPRVKLRHFDRHNSGVVSDIIVHIKSVYLEIDYVASHGLTPSFQPLTSGQSRPVMSAGSPETSHAFKQSSGTMQPPTAGNPIHYNAYSPTVGAPAKIPLVVEYH